MGDMTRKHPVQFLKMDENGTLIFTCNKVIRALVDRYPDSLNALHREFYNLENYEDYEQMLMLIGYSKDGFFDAVGSGLDIPGAMEKMIDATFEELQNTESTQTYEGRNNEIPSGCGIGLYTIKPGGIGDAS